MIEQKKTLTEKLNKYLTLRGLNPQAEVRTAAGVADIVTDKTVYEIVPFLTAEAFQKAIERVLKYRDALGGSYKPVIYGRLPPDDVSSVIAKARERGVTVTVMRDTDRPGMN
jgi:hypothetical protein